MRTIVYLYHLAHLLWCLRQPEKLLSVFTSTAYPFRYTRMSLASIHDLSLFYQLLLCPLTTLFIISLTFIYSRISVFGTSIRPYTYTCHDLFQYSPTDIDHISSTINATNVSLPMKNSYYRIFSSQFIHTNFLHFLFNLITLWECRKVILLNYVTLRFYRIIVGGILFRLLIFL